MANSSMTTKHWDASVKWICTHDDRGDTRNLSYTKPDTSREVTLDIDYDPVSKVGLFKIRAPVDVKGEMMPLFLYISPDRMTSLVYIESDGTPGIMPYFQFGLKQPADLVVPSGTSLLLKRPKLDLSTLNSLKLLAQETTLCVYIPHDDLMLETLLRPLCAAVAEQSLKHSNMNTELLGLYRGGGSKILQGADLRLPPSPPSYDEPGEPPAPYSPKSSKSVLTLLIIHTADVMIGAAQAGSSRKRPRVGFSDLSHSEPEDIEAGS